MMPAAKHFDPVMGVDVHMIQPPGPVPPVPIPHPFVGFFMDPADYAPVIGSTVYVNGVPRVQAGSGSSVPSIVFHIPMGGTFIKPIGNEGEAYMGSSSVLAEDEPFSYLSLPVLSCSCIGMPPPPRKKGGGGGLMLPTSIVTPIPAGAPVLVGGAPTISLMAVGMKLGMAGLGKLAGKLRKMQKSSKRMKKISDKLHKAADKIMDKLGVPPSVRNKVHRGICSVTGHPVDIATGKVFTEHTDIQLPGPIPFSWERVYFTTSMYEGPMGHGWHHSYDLALYCDREEEITVVRLADGRMAEFPILKKGDRHFNRKEKLTLINDGKRYILKDQSGLWLIFKKLNSSPDIYRLVSVGNRNKHKISFTYDYKGNLEQVMDSAGRELQIISDEENRIREIYGPHPNEKDETILLVSYNYNKYGDLIKADDALKQSFCYDYKNHLLIKETNRNGLNFYFEYEGNDENAHCIHTWGDDGIYDHQLTYFPGDGMTIVENSLGHKTHHYYNSEGVVIEVIDALGNSSYTKYNEFNEVAEELDELGRTTGYAYDERGNQISIVLPDGAGISMEFDEEDQLVEAIDAVGGKWQWKYDKYGNLVQRKDCLNRFTQYNYWQGLLNMVTDAAGNNTRLDYDKWLNLSKLVTPDGGESQWDYDFLGRCITVTDPNGNIQRRYFDELGRVIKVEEPDGNTRELKYDGESNVLQAKDKQHDVAFTYKGMNRLASRSEAGTTVKFHYDTEDQLTGITNEQGSVYRFELDPLGNVFKEIGFDQLTRTYYRDTAGQVIKVERPEEKWTKYEYDPAGRVTRVNYHDETNEKYEYRGDGELLGAENQHQKVQFERDLFGQVSREVQGEFEVASFYDILGRRTKLTSSLGANIDITRNAMGDVEHLGAQQGDGITWNAVFNRDKMGLEIERSLPGGIRSITKRDKLGRPIHHIIRGSGGNFMDKRYQWDVNDRLRKILDAHHGTTSFDHDALGNLAGAQYGDGSFEFRMPDAVGNLFKAKDQKDRKYGPAGQLLEAMGTTYDYDAEGNLIKKTEASGKVWLYQWNASGMLAKVIRPDGYEVSFTYDALGRRLSKTFHNKTTRWVWDGNVPLHEWVETAIQQETKQDYSTKGPESINKAKELISNAPANGPPSAVTTWVFEPESFAPVAKLVGEERFSIISNYLGTPTQMFDANGKQIWAADTTIYGDLLNLKGRRDACPFRYPGQYEDVETGLYYNRFRYYDPQSGGYVSQDPIGLLAQNLNLYSYVPDVNYFIDIFGLEIIYRLLRSDEDPSKGLSAKKPNRGMTVHGHVSSGSRNKGSQFISTSKDPTYLADKWHSPGQKMVAIDTDKLGPNVQIIDISTKEKAIASGVGSGSANIPAKSKEVLLVGEIPADAMEEVDANKFKTNCK
ncbi:DUF6531 domain-containing protein [Saccharicrinis sp. 156]|uniref:DUF6531 domain-containing protein n=1 Tax=Saccharicrinis sp. 156 TaxID=3417574 RepID=UPI003D35414E